MMIKTMNPKDCRQKYVLVPLILTLVSMVTLFSGCDSLSKGAAGTIIFISDRVQIEGSEQYPGYQLNNEIYQMDGNGNNIKMITDTIGIKQYASFSPNGKKIVFEYSAEDVPNTGIYIMDADGKNTIRLSVVDPPGLNPSGTLPGQFKDNRDTQPSWSPDGKWIVFVSYRDGNAEIYKMTPDGKNQTRLTQNPAQDQDPSWSPDSKHIIFSSIVGSNEDPYAQLYVMDTDGSNQIRLTDTADGSNNYPAWSADGKKIAFSSSRTGYSNIYVMNADGTNQVNLINSPEEDFMPAWSPDGKYIAFGSTRDSTGGVQNINNEIYRMQADGSNQVRLTNNPGMDGFPCWKP
jgi:Tol biopolymer transport system component